MEVLLRKLIPKLKLYNFPLIIFLYERYAQLRYSSKFNNEIAFRDATFVIGDDVTLFPSVYLGTYEKCELDILLSHEFPKDLIFWDIGANVGLYSVLLAKKYPMAQVVSFEPNAEIHSLLSRNFVINNIQNAQIEAVAVSNVNGQGALDLKSKRAGAARMTSTFNPTFDTRSFPVTTGKSFLDSNPKLTPHLIKIDVEGHEPEVIMGMEEILILHKPVLMLEVFKNLWISDRGEIWERTIKSLFKVYVSAYLITDGEYQTITQWNSRFLTGGMQTLIFGINQ